MQRAPSPRGAQSNKELILNTETSTPLSQPTTFLATNLAPWRNYKVPKKLSFHGTIATCGTIVKEGKFCSMALVKT